MTLAALALATVLVWDAGGRADVPPELWTRNAHPTLAVPFVNFAVQLTVNGKVVFGPEAPTGSRLWRTYHLATVDLTGSVDGSSPDLRWRALGDQGPSDRLPPIRLGPRAEVEAWVFWHRFFGQEILFAAALNSLIVAAFALGGFLSSSRPRRTTGLWFVLAGVSFGVGWLPNLFEESGLPVEWLFGAGIVGQIAWFVSMSGLVLDMGGWSGRSRWWGRRLLVPALLLVLPALFLHDAGVLEGYRPTVPFSPYAASALVVVFLVLWVRTWRSNRELLSLRTQELDDLNRRLHEEVDSRNEDLSQFVSVLSHDMKNSLYGLRQVTRRLAQHPEPQPQLMVTLDETVHRVQAVLQSLLNLSSSSLGTLHPVPVEVSAGELWDLLEAEVTEDAVARGVRVERSGDESPRFATDPAMATTILRNFFGNALKVSPTGASIRLLSRTTGAEVILAVIDSGPGLTADQVAGLFDLENRRVMMRPGDQPKGFGLILARNLADRLGHRIDVRSTPRVGSSFALVVRV